MALRRASAGLASGWMPLVLALVRGAVDEFKLKIKIIVH